MVRRSGGGDGRGGGHGYLRDFGTRSVYAIVIAATPERVEVMSHDRFPATLRSGYSRSRRWFR
ncbi:hypothetical protein EBESD8_450 [Rhodococcus aetherivorans]|nr:hypothetical protein EBESD8_450 [Rhodococcus aetherivorans]